MKRIDDWTLVLSAFFISFAGGLLFCLTAFGQTQCQAQQGGRYVVFVYQGYSQQQFGNNDRNCAIELIRRVRGEGYRFTNPYTRNAVWWLGANLEVLDTSDPSGSKGEAKKILAEALPGAVAVP